MAPTIIVGDDESPADVAAELLELADNMRQVKTRTDLRRPAFAVPDDLYDKYTARRKDRSDDEQRENAVEAAGGDDPDAIVSDDDLPPGAKNADPATLDEQLGEDAAGDALPPSAVNARQPADDSGDQADEQAKPVKAVKRAAPRKATRARKATKATAPAADAGAE